ncbi:PREDICTED: uncharacterized protein LOC106811235 [Priapulus caudatus]|uniref:Uncharacterized protein LOC106811235 n=1 Tax=Priapulus caudatus TaxID=37621 RepID=A0ABM1EDK3_PRICU|nr:PREDICTED: uncharacterized protein LOC106811235 [Priapulus caudatus]
MSRRGIRRSRRNAYSVTRRLARTWRVESSRSSTVWSRGTPRPSESRSRISVSYGTDNSDSECDEVRLHRRSHVLTRLYHFLVWLVTACWWTVGGMFYKTVITIFTLDGWLLSRVTRLSRSSSTQTDMSRRTASGQGSRRFARGPQGGATTTTTYTTRRYTTTTYGGARHGDGFLRRVAAGSKSAVLALLWLPWKLVSLALLPVYYVGSVVLVVVRGAWRGVVDLRRHSDARRPSVPDDGYSSDVDPTAWMPASQVAPAEGGAAAWAWAVAAYPWRVACRGLRAVRAAHFSLMFSLFLLSRRACGAIAATASAAVRLPCHAAKRASLLFTELLWEAEHRPEYEEEQRQMSMQWEDAYPAVDSSSLSESMHEAASATRGALCTTIVWLLSPITWILMSLYLLAGSVCGGVRRLFRRREKEASVDGPVTRSRAKAMPGDEEEEEEEEGGERRGWGRKVVGVLLSPFYLLWLALWYATRPIAAASSYAASSKHPQTSSEDEPEYRGEEKQRWSVAAAMRRVFSSVFHVVSHVVFWPVYGVLGIAWIVTLPFVTAYRVVAAATASRRRDDSVADEDDVVGDGRRDDDEDVVMLEERMQRLRLQRGAAERLCILLLTLLRLPVSLVALLLRCAAAPLTWLGSKVTTWRSRRAESSGADVTRATRRQTRSMAAQEREEEEKEEGGFWRSAVAAVIHILLLPWYVLLAAVTVLVTLITLIVNALRSPWQRVGAADGEKESGKMSVFGDAARWISRPFCVAWATVARRSDDEGGTTWSKEEFEERKEGGVYTMKTRKMTVTVTREGGDGKEGGKPRRGRACELLLHVLTSPLRALRGAYALLLAFLHAISLGDARALATLTRGSHATVDAARWLCRSPRTLYARIRKKPPAGGTTEEEDAEEEEEEATSRSFLAIRGGVFGVPARAAARVLSSVTSGVVTGIGNVFRGCGAAVAMLFARVRGAGAESLARLRERALVVGTAAWGGVGGVLALPFKCLAWLLLAGWAVLCNVASGCWSLIRNVASGCWARVCNAASGCWMLASRSLSSAWRVVAFPATWLRSDAQHVVPPGGEQVPLWAWMSRWVVSIFEWVSLLDAWLLSRRAACCVWLPLLLLPLILFGAGYKVYEYRDEITSSLPDLPSAPTLPVMGLWSKNSVAKTAAPPIVANLPLGGIDADTRAMILDLITRQNNQLTAFQVEDMVRTMIKDELAVLHANVRGEANQHEAQQVQRMSLHEGSLSQLQAKMDVLKLMSEELTSELSQAKAKIYQGDRSSGASHEHAEAMAAALVGLHADIDGISLAHSALVADMRNCCRNATYYEQLLQRRIEEALAGVMSSDGHGHDAGFGDWLRAEFVTHSNMEQKVAAIVKDMSSKMDVKVAEAEMKAGERAETVAAGIVMAAASQSSENASHSKAVLTESTVRGIIQAELDKFNADKTGQVDYALESAGGSIISTRCSETYRGHSAQISLFGIPLWYTFTSPRSVIQPEVHPGQCWALKGSHGYLVIQLSGWVKPTSFSMEHIDKRLSPTGTIDSAPRDFQILGLKHAKVTEGVHLGTYRFDANAPPLQYFHVADPEVEAYPIIELRILSNHGNKDYTCLYRFRVHGIYVGPYTP